MALSTDIKLPASITPRFPDRCLVCNEKPDSTLKISQHGANPWATFFNPILWFTKWSRVEIPVCHTCKFRFRMERWLREIATWGIVIVTVFAVAPYFPEMEGLTRKIVIGAIVVAVLLPYIAIETYWPKSFDTSADNNVVTYEFASLDYAVEFMVENYEHVVK